MQIGVLRRQIAALEASISRQSEMMLARLPAEYGFADVQSFVRAVRKAATTSRGPAALRVDPRPRLRAKITDDTRARVRALVKTGETSARIASMLQISVPSVQNIKRAAGLVKKRARRG